MNHHEATKILDMAKEGQPIPEDVMAEALFMTGDAASWLDIPSRDVTAFVQALREAGLL
jgi:hypothetical protein